MNDEWSRCPICFEDYGSLHRPTTFFCGHSTCIDHTRGSNQLRRCPACRAPLLQGIDCHVSYNLEEAAKLFHLIRDKIDWSAIASPSSIVPNRHTDTAISMMMDDELYARKLQAKINQEMIDESTHDTLVSPIYETMMTERQRTMRSQTTNELRDPLLKECGHRCDLGSTRNCCKCSDRRPTTGVGSRAENIRCRRVNDNLLRSQYYCPMYK